MAAAVFNAPFFGSSTAKTQGELENEVIHLTYPYLHTSNKPGSFHKEEFHHRNPVDSMRCFRCFP